MKVLQKKNIIMTLIVVSISYFAQTACDSRYGRDRGISTNNSRVDVGVGNAGVGVTGRDRRLGTNNMTNGDYGIRQNNRYDNNYNNYQGSRSGYMNNADKPEMYNDDMNYNMNESSASYTK